MINKLPPEMLFKILAKEKKQQQPMPQPQQQPSVQGMPQKQSIYTSLKVK